METKNIWWVVAALVVAGLLAWQFGYFGGRQPVAENLAQPPATTEAPAQPAPAPAPAQPSTTQPAPATTPQ